MCHQDTYLLAIILLRMESQYVILDYESKKKRTGLCVDSKFDHRDVYGIMNISSCTKMKKKKKMLKMKMTVTNAKDIFYIIVNSN